MKKINIVSTLQSKNEDPIGDMARGLEKKAALPVKIILFLCVAYFLTFFLMEVLWK